MALALITGASSGLGSEFAKLFADKGHSLILVARRRDRLEDIARALKGIHPQIQVHVVEQDLSHPGAGTELFAKVRGLGEVTYLVNNAGFGTNGSFSAQPLSKELEMIDLNIRSLVELTHLFLPAMLARKNGRILNVASTAAYQPGPYMANYYAGKAFVGSFSEALHEELKGSGVTCTVLSPGATRTEFAGAAGIENSRLFQIGAASAVGVARAGFRGMMVGRAIVVTGLLNNVMLQALRVTPRCVARKIAGFLNRQS